MRRPFRPAAKLRVRTCVLPRSAAPVRLSSVYGAAKRQAVSNALLSAELIETTRLHLRQSFASESSLDVKALLGEGTFGKVYSGERAGQFGSIWGGGAKKRLSASSQVLLVPPALMCTWPLV